MAAPVFDPKSPMVQELLKRSMAEQAQKTQMDPQAAETPSAVNPMSPHAASIMGGLADAISTYMFLKRGTATEDNAAVGGMHNSPAKVAGTAFAMIPAIQLAGKLVHKVAPRLSDAVLANQGALQTGYGANNFKDGAFADPHSHAESPSSSQAYTAALERALAASVKR